MIDDIQKETERIHQGIVESLSFSDALAKRDAEIERLRREVGDLNAGWQRTYDHDCNLMKAEIERLRGLLRDARDDVAECASRDWKPHRIEAYKKQLAEIDEALRR